MGFWRAIVGGGGSQEELVGVERKRTQSISNMAYTNADQTTSEDPLPLPPPPYHHRHPQFQNHQISFGLMQSSSSSSSIPANYLSVTTILTPLFIPFDFLFVYVYIFMYTYSLAMWVGYVCMYLCVSRSSKDSGAYDLGDLDQALLLYLDGQGQGQTDSSTLQDQRLRELLYFISFSFSHVCKLIFIQFIQFKILSLSLSFSLAFHFRVGETRRSDLEGGAMVCYFFGEG